MPEAIYHTRYSVHRCKYRRLLRRARTNPLLVLTRLPLLPSGFFPIAIKRVGEPSLVNFGRNSAHFDSHAIRGARKRPRFGGGDVTRLREFPREKQLREREEAPRFVASRLTRDYTVVLECSQNLFP